MCPSAVQMTSHSLMRNIPRAVPTFSRTSLKSPSQLQELKSVKFSCFAAVAMFGLLGIAAKTCYSMLCLREKGVYEFLRDVLFWRMGCSIVLITCWLIEPCSPNGQTVSVLPCTELKSVTLHADLGLNQSSLENRG